MLLLRCTAKLLKDIGVKDVGLANNIQTIDPIGSWYANLLRIDRRKCLIFTNETTLYSFLVPGIKKSDYKDFGLLFRVNLMLNLKCEGFDGGLVRTLLKGYEDYGFTKTESRSVLGSMNDMSFHYKYYIEDFGGLQRFSLMDANRRINELPMSAIGRERPISMLKLVLKR